MLVCPQPVLREACGDMAMLLMLAAMRKAAAGYRLTRSAGPPSGWDWGRMRQIVGEEPTGKTLGLIGFGRIGQTFAAKAQAAFGMRVVYYDKIRRAFIVDDPHAKTCLSKCA